MRPIIYVGILFILFNAALPAAALTVHNESDIPVTVKISTNDDRPLHTASIAEKSQIIHQLEPPEDQFKLYFYNGNQTLLGVCTASGADSVDFDYDIGLTDKTARELRCHTR